MTTSNSRLSYDDIFELLESVMDKEKGVRIPFKRRQTIPENRGEAMQFRVRIHTARQIDRADNRKLYEKDHPLHGRSRYDILRASIRTEDDEVFLYLEKRTLNDLDIEDLSQGAADGPA